MPLICIIGPDGAGKTTQARLLQKKLEQAGIQCKYVWLRFNHKISLPLLAFARAVGLSRAQQLKSGKKLVYHNFDKYRPVAFLYQYTLLVDVLLSSLMKVRIPLLLGKTVVCDRFVHDSLVDLIVSTKNVALLDDIVGRLFIALVPNAKIIMLYERMETLESRREDVKEDKNLQFRIRLYDMVASEFNVLVVRGDESISMIHSRIMQIIRFRANTLGS